MSTWYGPKPEVTTPKHPTPWRNDFNRVYDANGVLVIKIEGQSTFGNQDSEMAQILRNAVNAKALTPVEGLPRFYRKSKGSWFGHSSDVDAYFYYRQIQGEPFERLSGNHKAWVMATWENIEQMKSDLLEGQTVEEITHGLLPALAPATLPFMD